MGCQAPSTERSREVARNAARIKQKSKGEAGGILTAAPGPDLPCRTAIVQHLS